MERQGWNPADRDINVFVDDHLPEAAAFMIGRPPCLPVDGAAGVEPCRSGNSVGGTGCPGLDPGSSSGAGDGGFEANPPYDKTALRSALNLSGCSRFSMWPVFS